jgi:HAMP domain-containing protein
MIVILVVLALVAAIGSYMTERVDRPRRRLERMAQQPAE